MQHIENKSSLTSKCPDLQSVQEEGDQTWSKTSSIVQEGGNCEHRQSNTSRDESQRLEEPPIRFSRKIKDLVKRSSKLDNSVVPTLDLDAVVQQ